MHLSAAEQKRSGAFYTPDDLAACLVRWTVQSSQGRLLDPSCGDGRFIAAHRNCVGIEQDAVAAELAIQRAPWALVHEGDFFNWALSTPERFEFAAGNPPFIRYQSFSGAQREVAKTVCRRAGVAVSGLSSSWVPFLIGTSQLLNPGGRMCFVVPAEVGHAPYASPLIRHFVERFSLVHVIAVRQKLFPLLSEDCWILYADGYGGRTHAISFTAVERLNTNSCRPDVAHQIPVYSWAQWNYRLRPWLLSATGRELYSTAAQSSESKRLGEIARVGIGYVTGANDFFHLKPSEAREFGIPARFLRPSVRSARMLPTGDITKGSVEEWLRADQPVLLLHIPPNTKLPIGVRRYLEEPAGQQARKAYKCRVRDPWYSVPDVRTPDYVLTYMSGERPMLSKNDAKVSCTNTLHSVELLDHRNEGLLNSWSSELTQLSCELEGHGMGGGMLKLEPREASRVLLSNCPSVRSPKGERAIAEALKTLRAWRIQ